MGSGTHCSKTDGFPGTHGTHANGATALYIFITMISSNFSPGTALLTGQSPSSMAARLTGWIRHRTGSVPSKSAISGRRRHRTQSEGEKDEI